MSYLTCTNCGQKAPGEATKCRHCGRPFGRPPQRAEGTGSRRRSISVAVLLAGAALIILAAHELWPRLTVAPSAAPLETTTVSTRTVSTPPQPPAPAPAPRQSGAAPVESIRAVPPSPSRLPGESRLPVGDTAGPVAPTAPPEPVSIDAAHQRFAQVWANVRAERSNTAPVLRVLHPGEVVAVDSLQQGWYRVVTDQAVGYVDQHYLDTLPPSRP
jgi:ribosomal protein L40E